MKKLDTELKKYDYIFPPELIANKPAAPRDSAKLLFYNRKTKTTKFDTFKNINKYLPKNSLLVFNNTKVIPARFTAKKQTGGKVELLYINHSQTELRAPRISGRSCFRARSSYPSSSTRPKLQQTPGYGDSRSPRGVSALSFTLHSGCANAHHGLRKLSRKFPQ